MASKKRQQQLAAAKSERQEAKRAEETAKRKRVLIVTVAALAAIGLLVVAALAVFNRSSEAPTAAASDAPSAPVTAPDNVHCEDATGVNHSGSYSLPKTNELPVGSVLALDTNCGQIDIALEPKQAPITTSAIEYLVNEGWYNGNACSRLTTQGIYVIQCGAGSPDGSGGPGFSFKDENLPGQPPNNYPRGTVAMANAGPNTNSSQFFLVYQDTTLAPSYTVFGKVIKGLDILDYVAAQGVAANSPSPADGPLAQPLVIKTASVRTN